MTPLLGANGSCECAPNVWLPGAAPSACSGKREAKRSARRELFPFLQFDFGGALVIPVEQIVNPRQT
jgi:hypothetical protein